MRKKRLIFTLLYADGFYMLSRNFRLQKVGDYNWINNHYNFKNIAFSIDELVILDVSRDNRNVVKFAESVRKIINKVFVPVSIGGGVNSIEYAKILFESGADKLVVNTSLLENPLLIKDLIKLYGSQAIIASIDYIYESDKFELYNNNGQEQILNYNLYQYLEYVQDLGVGEIYLNSIRKDGTGHGFDIDVLEILLEKVSIPLILAGGAGNSKHLIEAAKNNIVDAVATANLFNFIGNALPRAREEMLNSEINLANFSKESCSIL